MLSDAPSGERMPCCIDIDAKVVELPHGGRTIVKLCECGKRLRSYPCPSGRWMCQSCGRSLL